MKLIILGSGTILSGNPARNCAGFLVDEYLLMDCGPGTWRALSELDVPSTEINYILISHFHTDHVGDLPALLLERYLLRDKVTSPLNIGGSSGLAEWFEKMKNFCGSWIAKLDICLSVLNNNKQDFYNYGVSGMPTGHTGESLCFRIEDKRKKVLFYSGDSGYNENIILMAKEADFAILEASMTEKTITEGHLTPALAGKIARKSGVNNLILTHMYPQVYQVDIEQEVKKEFSGKLILARDGMEIEI